MAMTRAPFSADDINAAINTAARRMTTTPTSPDLRARVMSHIDTARPRWGWRLAIAGGAIGVVAIAAGITWRVRPIAVSSPAVASAVTSAAAITASAEPEATIYWVAPPSHVTVVTAVRFHDTATAVMSNIAELEWQTRAVPALRTPDALAIDRIIQTNISIDPIDIAPLVVAPLPANGAGSR